MNNFITMSVMMLLASTSIANESPMSRIIAGDRTSANEADFYVALMEEYSWGAGSTYNPFCGATHIGEGRVVTAAHCVDSLPSNSSFFLLFGDTSDDMYKEYCFIDQSSPMYECISDRMGTPDLDVYEYSGYSAYDGDPGNLIGFSASDVRIHENYDDVDLDYDIAVIQLDSLFNYPVAALPDSDGFGTSAALEETSSFAVVGFGDTLSDTDSETAEPSDDLMIALLSAKQDTYCSDEWGTSFSTERMICAKGESDQDTCQGDSGGPLFNPVDGVLYGITSFGAVQCGPGAGVYTEVLAFKNWILELESEEPEVDEPDVGESDVADEVDASPIAEEVGGESNPSTPIENNTGSLGLLMLTLLVLLLSTRRADSVRYTIGYD